MWPGRPPLRAASPDGCALVILLDAAPHFLIERVLQLRTWSTCSVGATAAAVPCACLRSMRRMAPHPMLQHVWQESRIPMSIPPHLQLLGVCQHSLCVLSLRLRQQVAVFEATVVLVPCAIGDREFAEQAGITPLLTGSAAPPLTRSPAHTASTSALLGPSPKHNHPCQQVASLPTFRCAITSGSCRSSSRSQ